jgi:pimeloyl-ACP methyl ester carboxylesterase
MKRTTVSFANKAALRVKGILLEPDAIRASKTGVMYLPGIVLGLTSVHRLSVQIASEFQNMGYPVLLFDHTRIGESEGDLFSGPYEEFVALIKRGGLVDDTVEAIDYFLERCGLQDIILIGHCGGALTALYSTERSKKVSRLLMISPPLIGEASEAAGMTKAQSQEYLALYKHKVFSLGAWARLFSGKSDYRQMFQTVKAKIFRTKTSVETGAERLNRPFLEGLESVGQRIEVKIIYGDRDPGIEEFRSRQSEFGRWNVRATILPNASHGFVAEESMKMLMEELKV